MGWADELASRAGLSGHVADPAADDRALTAREQQVLELVAEGLSNGQIAERLYISRKTVSVHVSAILRKLGAASRTEAVRLAALASNESAERQARVGVGRRPLSPLAVALGHRRTGDERPRPRSRRAR